MKNDRGFTLIEILVTITILALIILIAVPSAITISKKVKEKLFDTKISEAGEATILWAQNNPECLKRKNEKCLMDVTKCYKIEETKNKIICSITIGELAENNIIKYDDEIEKQVYSPVDNKTSMNNIIISFIYNLDTKSVSLIPATKDGELSSSTTTSKRNIINTTTNQTTKISEPITTNSFCNAENLEKNYLIAAIANKYQNIGKPLTTPGKEVSKENESLMASTEDDYGMSYYFRGNVIDNYVEFANKCWRIVRITGNCGIKLVLSNDNINKSKNPCSAGNNDSKAAFARYDGNEYLTSFCSNSELDNANIGFMYGKIKADSYAYAQSNTNKSTILLNLEKWYNSNLLAYEEKLDDTVWCNDKSIVTDESFKPDSVFVLKKKYGASVNFNYYGPVKRLISSSGFSGGTGPSLKCPHDYNEGKLSKFTVKDAIYGNGNLTYKIGLLTADEVAFAGAVVIDQKGTPYKNNSYYLNENATGSIWWTISPYGLIGYNYGTNIFDAAPAGNLAFLNCWISLGLRPSISLNSNVKILKGTGTNSDPFIISD